MGTSFRVLSPYQCAFLDTARGNRQGFFVSQILMDRLNRYTLRILCLLLAGLTFGVYIFAMFSSRLQEFKYSYLCRTGSRITLYGSCQYARIILEMATVIVFALDRRENRTFDALRFSFISLSLFALVGLMMLSDSMSLS